MQRFRQFAGKMSRHWRAAFIVTVVVFIAAMFTYEPARKIYRIETNYLVSHDPLASTLQVEEERYYHWVMSEYVTYSLADWAQGTDFAERVRERISADYRVSFDIEDIVDAVSAGAIRSRLIVAFAGLDEAELKLIATAGYAEIVDVNREGLNIPQFTLAEPRIQPLDPEFVITEIDPTLGQIFALPLRIIGALVAGLAVSAYIAYRDPVIEDRRSLQPLRLPILGEIPSS
jgi:hypothetical protein